MAARADVAGSLTASGQGGAPGWGGGGDPSRRRHDRRWKSRAKLAGVGNPRSSDLGLRCYLPGPLRCCGDTIAGVVKPVEQVWNTWGYHVLVLMSFALQVTLLILADVRRRRKSSVISCVVWSAYMLADTTAVYALGHFFVSRRSTQHQLMALWAPLLLVHLGGQDNITAYAVEDNRLWLRHLQNLGVQVLAAAYVLYQSSVLSDPTWLRAATILIFMVDVLKYGERVWALRRASNVHSGELLWLDREEHEGTEMTKEDVDKMYHKIQMHLLKMYSVLYTKAVVMCTWQGICIRFISSLATLAAFILFHRFSDKYGYNRVDVAATYILLVGAGVLEITSVLRLIFSSWTMQGMMRSNRSCCKAIGLGLESARKLVYSSMRKADVHTMYWSGSMGQLDLCSPTRDSRIRKTMRWMGWCGWWTERDFSAWSIPVPTEIIEMLMQADQEVLPDVVLGEVAFEEEIGRAIHEMRLEQDRIKAEIERKIRVNQKSEENTMRQEMEIRKKERLEELMKMVKHRVDQSELRFLGIGTMGFEDEMESVLRGKDLEKNILVWHFATYAYLEWYKQQQVQDPKVNGLAKATKALSNYMIFLLAAHPLRPNGSPSQRACSFYNVMNHPEHIPIDNTCWMEDPEEIEATVKTGFNLGKKLIDRGNQCAFVKSIAHLWVHLLITVEDQLGEDFHVKQLSNGSEFLTVLSILVKYTQPEADRHQERRQEILHQSLGR
uniref:Uncharacterized protein n=1 Tax=Avena sativa TaxID=4498 RepID=A0ACD5XZV7_AVESA